MSVTFPVVIKVSEENKEKVNTITIPYNIYCEIYPQQDISLRVGSKKMKVEVKFSDVNDLMFVSHQIGEELGLCSSLKTSIKVTDNQLSLGPVIAVLTDNKSIYCAKEQKPADKMKKISEMNRNADTILYFFSCFDFYEEYEKINGAYYDFLTGKWEQRAFPFPDILYNRAGGVLEEEKNLLDNILKIIGDRENIIKFNSKYYFDKWDTYNNLRSYKEMESYLPLTIKYESYEDLYETLNKYSSLFIKETRGKRGIGVFKVTKRAEVYELSYLREGITSYNFDTFEGLYKKIEELINPKETIIQRDIETIKVNGCNIDMKPTIQRNIKGEVEITACPVRKGEPGCSIISSINGFETFTLEAFFAKFFNYSSEEINELMNRVEEFLLTCFSCIERSYGSFGEIGVDFSIDDEGKLWFIECNARPGKETICLAYDEKIIDKAFLNPLEYSKYLCGY